MEPFLNPTGTRYEGPLQTSPPVQCRCHPPCPDVCIAYLSSLQYSHQLHTAQVTSNEYIPLYDGPVSPTFINMDTTLTQFPGINLYQQSHNLSSHENAGYSQAPDPTCSTTGSAPYDLHLASMSSTVHRDDAYPLSGSNGARYNHELTSVSDIAVNGSWLPAYENRGASVTPANRSIAIRHDHPAYALMACQGRHPQYDESLATGYRLPADGWQSICPPAPNQPLDALYANAAHSPHTAATTTDRQMTLTPQDFEDMLQHGHGNGGRAPPNNKSLFCGVCLDGPFARPHERQRHESTVHAPPRWNCSLCGKAYRRKDTMDRHRREKHKHL